MKKWLATFLCLLATMPALAEEQPESPTIYRLPTAHECTRWENVNELLVLEFGEIPFVAAEGLVDIVTPQELVSTEHQLVIYVNPKTFTYSIVAIFIEDGMACILSSGGNFRPIQSNGTQL